MAARSLDHDFDKKLVKIKEKSVAVIAVTCSRCKETQTLEVDTTGGHLNIDFTIKQHMKFATVEATRDGRSSWAAKSRILCQPCTKELMLFLDGADADTRPVDELFATSDEPTHELLVTSGPRQLTAKQKAAAKLEKAEWEAHKGL